MNNTFSENLKKIRKDNNLSQEQLAEELGVSRQAISKWESAAAYPEMDKIIALCNKFDLNIDDLLNKDIREAKGEEETKKKLNKYVDDFLSFITGTINLFSNMTFKSKIKCLFEQIIISVILIIVFLVIGFIFGDLFGGVFGIIPDKVYYVIRSIIKFVYITFSSIVSLVVVVHIFKTRYLDYYEKIKKETVSVTIGDIQENEEETDNKEVADKDKKRDKKNKILFKKNEDKIIIRDPKHSEYKFINGLFKFVVGIIKTLALLVSIFFFIVLVCSLFAFVVSFLTYKTGVFFVGLMVAILAFAVINVVVILLLLNFVFNRKNDKKKMIWSFISSLALVGIGCGLIFIGTLNFEYVDNNAGVLKTDYIEFEMKDEMFFDESQKIEYIESNIDNIKVGYSINKYCDIGYSNANNIIYLWANCSDPIKAVKGFISNLNDGKIVTINNQIESIKIYASKENIDILKDNKASHYDNAKEREALVNSYENKISELQEKIDDYVEKTSEYESEIADLKDQIVMYENNEE